MDSLNSDNVEKDDKPESDAAIIKRLIQKYADIEMNYGDVVSEIVFDDATGHYELRHLGWEGPKRVHASILHIDARNGKVYIEHDGTEDGIAYELQDAGIPSSRIVLAFQYPFNRQFLPEYAPA